MSWFLDMCRSDSFDQFSVGTVYWIYLVVHELLNWNLFFLFKNVVVFIKIK